MAIEYSPPPAELDLITQVHGAEVTLALVRAFGCTRLYISARVLAGGELAASVGLAAAQAAGRAWGGDKLPVPLARQRQV